MQTVKKIIGWFLFALMFPVIGGLCTLNGEMCYHGNCVDCIPFWTGFFYFSIITFAAFSSLGMAHLIFKHLIFTEK